MTRLATAKRLDAQLAPLGFDRRNVTWNRTVGQLIDVVNLQVSKEGNAVTINAGVADPEVYAICWGDELTRSVDEPSCTVRARVGRLLDDIDVWCPIDDPETSEQIEDVGTRAVLPFIERMHTRESMADFLDTDPARPGYPPPVIYLAILRHLTGDKRGACEILDALSRTARGAWETRVAEVAGRLGC
jgi:hypothetical protein